MNDVTEVTDAIYESLHWIGQDIFRLALLSIVVGWLRTIKWYVVTVGDANAAVWKPHDYAAFFFYCQIEVAIGLTVGITFAYLAIDQAVPPALQQVVGIVQGGFYGVVDWISSN